MVKNTSKNKSKRTIKRWSPEEHDKLVYYVRQYGTKCWGSIASCIGTRDRKQCRSHYQKFQTSLQDACQEVQAPQSEKFQQVLHQKETLAPEIRQNQASEAAEPDNLSSAEVHSAIQLTEVDQYSNILEEVVPYVEEFPILVGTPASYFDDFQSEELIRQRSSEGHIRVTSNELDENENFWDMLDTDQQWVPLLDYVHQDS